MGARASTFDTAVASARDDADASGVDGFVQVSPKMDRKAALEDEPLTRAMTEALDALDAAPEATRYADRSEIRDLLDRVRARDAARALEDAHVDGHGFR
ncbi:unnamed product [Ostreococcus tauri]|uniref:Unnamed product n=1 Tax=Ostreococcus tauri TaxID=70448 RepID=A0A090M7E4_OSTTA|nr:unnamed product [Ostreococcus tauri]CEF98607.1 unnamed product [Ostreococcus tauri]|eukprot:XP_022839367.1 unnamed product [Ostreococcus tauri]